MELIALVDLVSATEVVVCSVVATVVVVAVVAFVVVVEVSTAVVVLIVLVVSTSVLSLAMVVSGAVRESLLAQPVNVKIVATAQSAVRTLVNIFISVSPFKRVYRL
jgi:hypothetical protein